MERRPEEQQGGPWLHFGSDGFRRVDQDLVLPQMASRPDARRPIGGRIRRERPHHIDQIFDTGCADGPHVLVAVRRLDQPAGEDLDRLCQVELDAVARGAEDILDDPQDELVPNEPVHVQRAP